MPIRKEEPADWPAVRVLHTEAFADDGTVADLVEALRPSIVDGKGASLVAEEDGHIVGHVMLTANLLDAPQRLVDVTVLSPLGVLPSHWRRGLGSALVLAGVETMEKAGVPLVFLEGSPSYYGRLGFSPGGDHTFRKPSLRIPDAAFQVVRLSAYEPWMTGTLVYREEFWRLDCVGLREA